MAILHRGWYLPNWPEQGWSQDLVIETINFADYPGSVGHIYKAGDFIRWRYEDQYGVDVLWPEQNYAPDALEECREQIQLSHLFQWGLLREAWDAEIHEDDLYTRTVTLTKRDSN